MVAKNPNIIKLEDTDESINMMIYGPSGVGKTVFGGSAQRVLFLAVESGTVSAKRQGSKAHVWPIETWADLEAAYEWLYDHEDPDDPDEHHGYDWVVIDSLTQMQQIALRAILDDAVKENANRDLDIPAIQDHQKWQNMFKRFVLGFCDLEVNVLFTALVRNEEDEEGEQFVTPDIQGKGYQMSQMVCGMMSAYGFMQVKRKKVQTSDGKSKVKRVRRITWQDTGVIRGKDRYDVLAPYTEDKTLQEITEMIQAEPAPAKSRRKDDEE